MKAFFSWLADNEKVKATFWAFVGAVVLATAQFLGFSLPTIPPADPAPIHAPVK